MKNDFMIQFGFGFVQKMLVVQKHFDIKIKTKYGQQKEKYELIAKNFGRCIV